MPDNNYVSHNNIPNVTWTDPTLMFEPSITDAISVTVDTTGTSSSDRIYYQPQGYIDEHGDFVITANSYVYKPVEYITIDLVLNKDQNKPPGTQLEFSFNKYKGY